MRYFLYVAITTSFIALPIAGPVIAADNSLVGKQAVWEIREVSPAQAIPAAANQGETIETPNHRRLRLGLPIEASFPPSESGVAEETPNQRRRRLGSAPNLAQADRPNIENLLNQ